MLTLNLICLLELRASMFNGLVDFSPSLIGPLLSDNVQMPLCALPVVSGDLSSLTRPNPWKLDGIRTGFRPDVNGPSGVKSTVPLMTRALSKDSGGSKE